MAIGNISGKRRAIGALDRIENGVQRFFCGRVIYIDQKHARTFTRKRDCRGTTVTDRRTGGLTCAKYDRAFSLQTAHLLCPALYLNVIFGTGTEDETLAYHCAHASILVSRHRTAREAGHAFICRDISCLPYAHVRPAVRCDLA